MQYPYINSFIKTFITFVLTYLRFLFTSSRPQFLWLSSIVILANQSEAIQRYHPIQAYYISTLSSFLRLHFTMDVHRSKCTLIALMNINSKDIACHLCRMIHREERKTIYGCFECGKGYHVNFFTAYHHRNGLEGNNHAVQQLLNRTYANYPSRTANRRSKHAANPQDAIVLLQPKRFRQI